MKALYESALVSLTVNCPSTGRKEEARFSSAYGSEADCEMCGSHGDVTITVDCDCGKQHEIELSSW